MAKRKSTKDKQRSWSDFLDVDWLTMEHISTLLPPDYIFKQKLLTLREAHEFTRCVTRSLVLCVCFVDRCLSFVLFLLAIVLSVLQYTDSDYPFFVHNAYATIRIISTMSWQNKITVKLFLYFGDRLKLMLSMKNFDIFIL
jgi:hypothetical protein